MRKLPAAAVGLTLAILMASTLATATNEYRGYPVASVTVNGSPVQSDVPAIIMDGRTLLPVRAVVDAMGGQVAWDQETFTVSITAPDSSTRDEKAPQDPADMKNLPADLREEIRTLTEIHHETGLLLQQAFAYQTILFKLSWAQNLGHSIDDDAMWNAAVANYDHWYAKAKHVEELVAQLPDFAEYMLVEREAPAVAISGYLEITHEGISTANQLVSYPQNFHQVWDMTYYNLGRWIEYLSAFNNASYERIMEITSE